MPDPFALDWDNLSETEMKRLVGQLEKTKNDLQMDLREMQAKLDKEGKEYHHFHDFFKLYRAEIASLNRTLDSLVRSGVVPASYVYGPLSGVGLKKAARKVIPFGILYFFSAQFLEWIDSQQRESHARQSDQEVSFADAGSRR